MPIGEQPPRIYPRQRKQFFHRIRSHSCFRTPWRPISGHFVLSGNDAHKITGFIAMQYQCFKYLLYILSQTGSHVYGTQIFLIHLIRNELVGNLLPYQAAGCICLVDFIFFSNYNCRLGEKHSVAEKTVCRPMPFQCHFSFRLF